MESESFNAAAKRLRRKLEVMRLDFKASNNNRKYDIEECLQLLGIMEKNVNEPQTDQTIHIEGVGASSSGPAQL